MAARDPYKYFRVEARELLEGLARGVDELAAGPARERVPLLLRLAHTLKGASRVVKLTDVSELAHKFEDVLAPHRDSPATLASAETEELRRLLDSMVARLSAIDLAASLPPAGQTPQSGTPAHEAPARAPLDTVSLQIAEIEAVLADVSDTSAWVSALGADLSRLEGASRDLRRLADRRLRAMRGYQEPDGAQDLRKAIDSLEAARQRAGDRVSRLGRNLGRLHDETGRLRMIPTEVLWGYLERVVRDAAQVVGKRARLSVATRVPRLDTPVFAALQEALLHLVRNAVAHGMEPEPDRIAARKDAEGTVHVALVQHPGRVVVTCSDDGRGIDAEAVRRAAAARGDRDDVARGPIGTREAIGLLMRGGVSTTRNTTEMSGRGVGLEAVRAALARLGGTMSMESEPGRGTSVSLDVPVSLMALEVLCVECDGSQVLIPLENVRRVVRPEIAAIHRTSHGDELHLDGQALPYAGLEWLLRPANRGARPSPPRHVTVVVLDSGGLQAACGVDRLLGTTEAVVRTLPSLADAADFVSGASLSAGGVPRLVLEAAGLCDAIRKAETGAPASPSRRASILVVDDSLTTRMLEQSILESAGYLVDLAVSGEEALARLRERRYDLLLVDVEMPGMDGFTLVGQLRRSPDWRAIPAILVTSRQSAEDKRRGLAAGAQDYVVKGDFDQRRLLARIGELLS